MDEEPWTNVHRQQHSQWVKEQMEAGTLTQRDLEWGERKPSEWITWYPEIGLTLGVVAAGIFSRQASRIKPWGFYRTIATAGAAGTGGFVCGAYLHDYSMTRFNTNNDNYILARIAQYRTLSALEKDRMEGGLQRAIFNQGSQPPPEYYQIGLLALDNAEKEFSERVVVETLVPEDVQVSNATPEEIRTAIESIVQEEIETEGIPMSEHDYELLLRINMEYWKDRPIFASQITNTLTAGIVGAIGIYGRLLQRQPMAWRWILLSGVPVYIGTSLWVQGFAQPALLGPGGPHSWWTYQLMNMEVRTNLATRIAMARVKKILKEGDISKLDGVLGSSSRDQIISIPPSLLSSLQETPEQNPENSDSAPNRS